MALASSMVYSSGLMTLPNNAVGRGHNEQAGNDVFDHLACQICIYANFIISAGLTLFCIDITQR